MPLFLSSLFITVAMTSLATGAITVFEIDLLPSEVVAADSDPANDPSGSDATGRASFTLNTDDPANPTLRYSITLNHLFFSQPRLLTDAPPGDSRRYVRAVHLHFGARGINGAFHALNIYGVPAEHDAQMQLALPSGATTTNTLSGVWDNSDANNNGTSMRMDDTVTLSEALSDLQNGRLYLQVHTLEYRQGELRGQLQAVPEPSSLLTLGGGTLFLVFRRRRPTRD